MEGKQLSSLIQWSKSSGLFSPSRPYILVLSNIAVRFQRSTSHWRGQRTTVTIPFYTALVKPHLVCSVQLFAPYCQKDMAQVEWVWRRAVKRIRVWTCWSMSMKLRKEKLRLSIMKNLPDSNIYYAAKHREVLDAQSLVTSKSQNRHNSGGNGPT